MHLSGSFPAAAQRFLSSVSPKLCKSLIDKAWHRSNGCVGLNSNTLDFIKRHLRSRRAASWASPQSYNGHCPHQLLQVRPFVCKNDLGVGLNLRLCLKRSIQSTLSRFGKGTVAWHTKVCDSF